MTDTRAALAEALRFAYGWHATERLRAKDVTADLAERGVLLVTEERFREVLWATVGEDDDIDRLWAALSGEATE